jgi:hypothetical protein
MMACLSIKLSTLPRRDIQDHQGQDSTYPAGIYHLVIAGAPTISTGTVAGYPTHVKVQKALMYSVYIGSMLSALAPGAQIEGISACHEQVAVFPRPGGITQVTLYRILPLAR